jgi:hypothetical protein
MKSLIRKWLGIEPAITEEVLKGLIVAEFREFIEGLKGSWVAQHAFEEEEDQKYRASVFEMFREEVRSSIHYELKAMPKSVEKELVAITKTEQFIDQIVDKINKKQIR